MKARVCKKKNAAPKKIKTFAQNLLQRLLFFKKNQLFYYVCAEPDPLSSISYILTALAPFHFFLLGPDLKPEIMVQNYLEKDAPDLFTFADKTHSPGLTTILLADDGDTISRIVIKITDGNFKLDRWKLLATSILFEKHFITYNYLSSADNYSHSRIEDGFIAQYSWYRI